MKYPAYVGTPFGDFQFVETDLSKGLSPCKQCDLYGTGHCHEVNCGQFDSLEHYYHLEERGPKISRVEISEDGCVFCGKQLCDFWLHDEMCPGCPLRLVFNAYNARKEVRNEK